jgi:hypothetical protein
MNIKDIVFYHINSLDGKVNIQEMTNEILSTHPGSKWDHTHWSFYRSQITSEKGRYSHLFSDEIKENLKKISYDRVNRPSVAINKSAISKSYSHQLEKDKWPLWEIPSDEEQISLAKILLPYIKILNPKIVALITEDNNKNLSIWQDQLYDLNIRPDIYLWQNSPVAFPGIRRHVGTSETSTFRTNPKLSMGENALYLDDNSYPKEIWSFALKNIRYGKKNPANYSLAHILDHKDYNTRNNDELIGFEKSEDKNLFAGLYTSCTNSIYIPTTFLKPTDHNSRIRQLLIQIVDKYYGSICNPLPHNLSFNLADIEDRWRLERFPEPTIVGKADNIHNFLVYRNNIINTRIKNYKFSEK